MMAGRQLLVQAFYKCKHHIMMMKKGLDCVLLILSIVASLSISPTSLFSVATVVLIGGCGYDCVTCTKQVYAFVLPLGVLRPHRHHDTTTTSTCRPTTLTSPSSTSSIMWPGLLVSSSSEEGVSRTIITNEVITPSSRIKDKKKIGFYIHIPYCRKRCRYCDFAIVPIGTNVDVHFKATVTAATTSIQSNNNLNTNQSISKQQSGFDKLNEEYTNAIITEIDSIIESLVVQVQTEASKIENNNGDEEEHLHDSSVIYLDSIYFGGGTPSLAPLSTIEKILQHLLKSRIQKRDSEISSYEQQSQIFRVTDQTEITMEMDPGTFTLKQLHSLKLLGINRISLGVQSFNNTILKSIGRVHTVDDVYNSISMISQVFGGGEGAKEDNSDKSCNINYSIDLISGLPGLDCAMWIETLQKATQLRPQPKHLSIYDLQIESGTVFGSWYENDILMREEEEEEEEGDYNNNDDSYRGSGNERQQRSQAERSTPIPLPNSSSKAMTSSVLPLPSPDDCAFMYQFASGYLRSKGFEHYEISSYAMSKTGSGTSKTPNQSYRSNHNQIYWAIGSQWYAAGLGATSCINGRRYARPRSMSDYVEWTKKLKYDQSTPLPLLSNLDVVGSSSSSSRKNVPIWLDGKESWQHDLEDTIMTRLRTKDGLNLNWIAEQKDGKNILDNILRGAKLGLELGLLKRDNVDGDDTLYLTDPKGFLFSNTIISSIFAELED